MSQRSIHDFEQGSFGTARTRRLSVGAGHGVPSLRTTTITPNARDLQIVDSTLSVVGGDVVHNQNHHYHYERSKDIWAILESIPNSRSIYHIMLSKATSGTGMWLVKGDKFRLWLEPNGDIKIFWGSGIPGAGKTLLASIVIERLETLRKESVAAICVCYVYFRYSDRSEMTVRNVLEILVKQVLERHPDCRTLIEQTYAQHIREGSEPTEGQLQELLQELANCMTCTFYVLDALDEAPTKIQLAVVRTIASLNVKLFITSRPLKAVEANFPEAHTFPIIAQDKDIDLHIAKRLDESADLQNLMRQAGPSLREEIVSTVKQNCGGMFLHAALQLDAICDCLSTQEVRLTLEAFPSTLAKAVLVWVLYASRPMTIEELERAVATSPTTHKFEASRLVPGTTLMSLCRGLVTVEEDSRIVRLVHYTAKDALQELLRELFPRPHSLLAAVCMTHLAECGFQNTTINSPDELGAALKGDPLLAYASEAWAFHARAGLEVEDTKCLTAQFITQSNTFPAFTSIDRIRAFDLLTPLHILGLYNLPLALIEATVVSNPNITTPVFQRSPLIIASRFNCEDLAARLLELPETRVNLADVDEWSALMFAARWGSEGIAKLLLAHPEIQVNKVGEGGWSALMMAARYGFEGIIVLLLAHPDIHVDLVQNDGWSAFMLGVNEGYEGIVKLFLAHPGIQVNLANNDGLTPLIRAAQCGDEGIVKLILTQAEIQINLVNSLGWSALMMAASYGFEGVITLLLACPGIQVNLANHKGWSALMLAAKGGHECVVALLLAHPGINVNLLNNGGWSAFTHGCVGVLKLLLPHPGIQISLIANHASTTALLLAAEHGHTAAVELLLSTGAFDVNAYDGDRDTAIKMAAEEGHEAIVRMLLDVPNIDTMTRSTRDDHTALSAAEANGHSSIVALLQDFESRNAVMSSSSKISQLSLHDSSNDEDSDSDSSCSDSYQDAEEGLEDH